jgi:hypothetical protein
VKFCRDLLPLAFVLVSRVSSTGREREMREGGKKNMGLTNKLKKYLNKVDCIIENLLEFNAKK